MAMSELGQKAKYSLRADVFRFTPQSRHQLSRPRRPFRATSGHAGAHQPLLNFAMHEPHFGLVTASQIASASVVSFFCRLT
jgi:hypothetical protein